MRIALLALLLFAGPDHTGPAVGSAIPPFSLVDQNGNRHTASSILGPKGALLVFSRSADW